jgi:hypothetical protein
VGDGGVVVSAGACQAWPANPAAPPPFPPSPGRPLQNYRERLSRTRPPPPKKKTRPTVLASSEKLATSGPVAVAAGTVVLNLFACGNALTAVTNALLMAVHRVVLLYVRVEGTRPGGAEPRPRARGRPSPSRYTAGEAAVCSTTGAVEPWIHLAKLRFLELSRMNRIISLHTP